MTARVIHTAQALADEVVEVPALPRRGGNVMAGAHRLYAGGAVTILLAAARSGARCVHAGAHGSGPNGDLVRAALGAAGIAVSSPPVADLDTGVCFVMIEPSAQRTFVTSQGAERWVSPESLQLADPRPGDLVCISGYALVGRPRDPLLAWLDTLPAAVIVVLDPGSTFAELDPAVQALALARTTVWTSNAEEAQGLTGLAPIERSAPAVAAVLPPGAVVVVRDGPAGCVVHEGGRTTAVPDYPQRPVDTNGAGDTHTGVLVAVRAAGASWVEAARRANAAGAIKVTRMGPDSTPTASEIDAFLAREQLDVVAARTGR